MHSSLVVRVAWDHLIQEQPESKINCLLQLPISDELSLFTRHKYFFPGLKLHFAFLLKMFFVPRDNGII